MIGNRLQDILLPEYSLRFHKSGVTASIFVEWPLRIEVPILITGDSTGSIVLWNLITRRRILACNVDGGAQVVALQDLGNGLIALLSKDHKLRLFEFIKEESKSVVEAKANTSSLCPSFELRKRYEIPVNTLNFANFVVQELSYDYYRLICINTQDSEAIDVYHFHLSDMRSLRRVFKGVTFGGAIQQLSSDPESAKAGKLGIIMRFLEHRGTIYCGFESGLVIGFEIHDIVREEPNSNKDAAANKRQYIQIIYVSSVHYPEPVLDLELDEDSDAILSSSTKSIIGVHQVVSVPVVEPSDSKLIHDQAQSVIMRRSIIIHHSNFKQIPASSVGHLAVVSGNLVVSTWAGLTFVLGPDCRELARMSKSRSNVLVSDSSQGSLQGSYGEKADKRFSKITSLSGISSTELQQFFKSDRLLTFRPGEIRRILDFSAKSWCVIGYDDGSIAVHRIQSDQKSLLR